MAENNALAIITLDVEQSLEKAKKLHQIVLALRKDLLIKGVDYGEIPGTTKPTLLKPGAEKLCWALGLSPEFESVDTIQDFEKPLFHYRYRCVLRHIETGKVVATGIGSCNSMEGKYGFRWVSINDIPSQLKNETLLTRGGKISEPVFAIEKGETSGKYGKPSEYWQRFKDAMANGSGQAIQRKTRDGKPMEAYEISDIQYRIPNEDVFSIVNTIDKMAQKRALIAAILIGANASEFFTQDIEDMPNFSQAAVIEGEIIEDNKERPKPKPKKQQNGKTEDKDIPFFAIESRRVKVFEQVGDKFNDNMTEMMEFCETLQIKWGQDKSDDIVVKINKALALAPTGTEDDIPF